jgi:Protein of unknown function (DUF5672)
MKNIAAVIIDTYPNKGLALNAINMAKRLSVVNKIYIFSDEYFCEDATFIKIPIIYSNNQYGSVIFDQLLEHISEEHFFIIQWDGFPLFPQCWDNTFLNYDYVGAPIDGWVGNGGFSLRSRKLLEVCRKLNICLDPSITLDQPEDQIICKSNKILLENNGIKFAPVELAQKFSYQHGPLNHAILGFHGPENLPIFIPERDLVMVANEIIERIAQPLIMLGFLSNCVKLNFYSLFKACVTDYTDKPNLLRAIDYEMSNNPTSNLLESIKIINKTRMG